MALNPEEIIIGGNHRVHVAPEGTTLPTSISDLLDGAFVDLGYTEQTGVKFTDTKTIGKVLPSQSFYPVRQYVQDREATVEFSLLQWNEESLILAFGGGTVTEPSVGKFRYHPPAPQSIGVSAMVVDIQDGTRNFRITIERGFVTSNTVSTFSRTAAGMLPITFSVLAPLGTDPWTFDTDDAIFGVLGS